MVLQVAFIELQLEPSPDAQHMCHSMADLIIFSTLACLDVQLGGMVYQIWPFLLVAHYKLLE